MRPRGQSRSRSTCSSDADIAVAPREHTSSRLRQVRLAIGPCRVTDKHSSQARKTGGRDRAMKRSQKLSAAVAAALGAYGLGSGAAHATTAYLDDFNRASLNAGTYAYTTTATNSSDGGAEIGATFNGNVQTANLLTLTNDATANANANGYVYTT